MHATLLGITFDFQGLTFYQTNKDVEIGDLVVCQTSHGTYLGKVEKKREATDEEMAKADFSTLFPPIVRIATFQDQAFAAKASEKERLICCETQKQADNLNLEMKIHAAHLDVDDNKVLITFTAEGRVDFRELVKILNGMFRLRIELRQIGPRDQARLVGGIGTCGLPLCCTTFLKTFDGISIAMAKNQLLAINIPKLSGACNKLMCCLKFEDKAYSELRPTYPKMNEKIHYRNTDYTVTGINVLTDSITLYNGSGYENVNREQLERIRKGLDKVEEKTVFKDINSGVDLSGRGIQDTNERIAQIRRSEERRKEELANRAKKNEMAKKASGNNRNSPHHQNGGNNRNQNGNRNGQSRNFNRSNHYSHSYSNARARESGFIPVSQIADKEVLSIKGHVKSEEEKKGNEKK